MKKIPLVGQRGVGKFALVDDEDFEYLSQWRWFYGDTGYATHSAGPRKARKTIRMHRLLMNTPKGMETDHINRDKLDNQKPNLRICTRFENSMNRPKQINNKSGYKGVYWHKQTKAWHAVIVIKGKHISLGTHKNVTDAAKAYEKAFQRFIIQT